MTYTGTLFIRIVVNSAMEKRGLGLLLTLLGIAGLIIAAFNFINHSGGAHDFKVITTCITLGIIFFFSGIGLIRSTKDTLKNDEHVS
jgi:hypothetical protein